MFCNTVGFPQYLPNSYYISKGGNVTAKTGNSDQKSVTDVPPNGDKGTPHSSVGSILRINYSIRFPVRGPDIRF